MASIATTFVPARALKAHHVVEVVEIVDTEEETSYHQDKEAQYLLPNNSPEHIRLEEQAALLSAVQNHRVLHAPVRDGADVRTLDIGCGTGIVTHLMGKTFPSAQCYGLDLSLVPNIRPKTANVHFLQGNVTAQTPSEWRFNDNNTASPSPFTQTTTPFDYVFSRLLLLGMSNWPSYIRTQFTLLKPGGWAEIHDLDWEYFNASNQPIQSTWLPTLARICEGEKGMDFHCGSRAAGWMREAGFVDVQVVRYRWSYGTTMEVGLDPAAREYSCWMVKHQPEMLEKMLGHVMEGRGTVEETREMQREMRETLRPEVGKYMWFYVTVGRKPE